jgi:hypothetical protein
MDFEGGSKFMVFTPIYEHVFHVDEYDWDTNIEPNFGLWESFDTMIVGVSKLYAKLWKL